MWSFYAIWQPSAINPLKNLRARIASTLRPNMAKERDVKLATRAGRLANRNNAQVAVTNNASD